jgi:hypothetical protein
MKKTVFEILLDKQHCDPIEYAKNAGTVYEMMEYGATIEEIEEFIEDEE